MIEHSADVSELFKAIHKAQASLNGVAKDSVNPHFKNSYASLEGVIAAAKDPLQSSGLAFTQAPGVILDNSIEVTTMLMHVSGQWLRSTMHVPLAKRDPQGAGSAITYGCRYSLMATLGLPPVDDDGESAMNRDRPRRPESQSQDMPSQYDDLATDIMDDLSTARSFEALSSIAAHRKAEVEALPEKQANRVRQHFQNLKSKYPQKRAA